MSEKKPKKSTEAQPSDPPEVSADAEEQEEDGGDQESPASSPFKFRRLDGQDPMKYEDVADK